MKPVPSLPGSCRYREDWYRKTACGLYLVLRPLQFLKSKAAFQYTSISQAETVLPTKLLEI